MACCSEQSRFASVDAVNIIYSGSVKSLEIKRIVSTLPSGPPTSEKRATRYAAIASSFAKQGRSASDMELNELRIRLLASRRV